MHVGLPGPVILFLFVFMRYKDSGSEVLPWTSSKARLPALVVGSFRWEAVQSKVLCSTSPTPAHKWEEAFMLTM